jgi:phage terminase small subunit
VTLTLKQEAFAQAYVETGNASEAYRRAYDVSPECKPRTIEKRASEMLKNGAVTGRLAQLQAKVAKKHEITVDSLVQELELARTAAMTNPRGISAAVSATMGKAKLLGLVVDKAETTGPNGGPMQVHNRIEYAIVDTKG